MLEDVNARLLSFGYTVNENDNWILGFIIKKVNDEIISELNVTTIPDTLYNNAIDRVVGKFFFELKNLGKLTEFDITEIVKSIQEGDTRVEYAIGSGSKTPEQRLDDVIKSLMISGTSSFSRYRCIVW